MKAALVCSTRPVLPEEQAKALRRHKQRQARDKGRTLSPEALFLAGFVLLVSTLPARTPQSAQAMIYARLLAWMLIEEDIQTLRRQLSDGKPAACPLSSWRLAQLAFASLRKVLEGHWTPQRLRAVLPELRRLFVERRQRPLREHQGRYQFCQQVLCQADLVVLFDCSSA